MATFVLKASVGGADIYSTEPSTRVRLREDSVGVIEAYRYNLESNGPFNKSSVQFAIDPELWAEHLANGGTDQIQYQIVMDDGTILGDINNPGSYIRTGQTYLGTLYTAPDNCFVYTFSNKNLMGLDSTYGGGYRLELALNVGQNFEYSAVHQTVPALVNVFASWITPSAPGTQLNLKEIHGVESVVNMGTVIADGSQEYIIARVNLGRTFKNRDSYHCDTKCFAAQGTGQMWAPSDYIYWGTRRGIVKQQTDTYVDIWQNKVQNANQRCLITFSATGIAFK